MKRMAVIFLMLFLSAAARAELRVVTSYQYIADIVARIGKDKVGVAALAPGSWDPHFVTAKPSYIAKVRNAGLLIINGAELEIGWMPPILREARNVKVQPGAGGFLDLSSSVKLIDIPAEVSRALGDVHPSGNPHFQMDPHNITLIAGAICRKLAAIDHTNGEYYKSNLAAFDQLWNGKVASWDKALSGLRGKKVIQYHRIFDYLLRRYGIISVGEIEPLPGIPPTSAHTSELIETAKKQGISMVLTDVYHPLAPARYIADKAGVKLVVVPHDLDEGGGVKDIVALFDTIVRRLTGD